MSDGARGGGLVNRVEEGGVRGQRSGRVAGCGCGDAQPICGCELNISSVISILFSTTPCSNNVKRNL